MTFLADIGISPRTVSKLRREGYDAVHLALAVCQSLFTKEKIKKKFNCSTIKTVKQSNLSENKQ